MLDVWFASLGPGRLRAARGRRARRRSAGRRRRRPRRRSREPKIIEGYELVKPLGEGGIGTVWLVRKPGADRFFVLKIPKADALANATETERAGILASFVEEAKALAGLYHPNVANIIDRGVVRGRAVPGARVPDRRGPQAVLGGAARCRSSSCVRSCSSRARGSPRCTARASCTATSSRRTSGCACRSRAASASTRRSTAIPRSPRRSRPWSSTSAWCARSRVPQDAERALRRGHRRATSRPSRCSIPSSSIGAPTSTRSPARSTTSRPGARSSTTSQSPRDRIIAHMQRDPLEDAERLAHVPRRRSRSSCAPRPHAERGRPPDAARVRARVRRVTLTEAILLERAAHELGPTRGRRRWRARDTAAAA